MKGKRVIEKNLLTGILGVIPMGAFPSAIINSIYELKEAKDLDKAMEDLYKSLTDLVDCITYVEDKIDDTCEGFSFEFNNRLTEDQYSELVEILGELDVPLSEIEMWEDFDGMNIHLNEVIIGYDVKRAERQMNEILKRISPELAVCNVDY